MLSRNGTVYYKANFVYFKKVGWPFLLRPRVTIFPPKMTYLIWLSHPSSSVVRLPVDEPALASTMTHDHAEELCTSELGPLRI